VAGARDAALRDHVAAPAAEAGEASPAAELPPEPTLEAYLRHAALDRPPAAPVPWPKAMAHERLAAADAEVLAWMRESSPGLEAIEAEMARHGSAVELARKGYYPDFGLGLTYIETGHAAMHNSASGKDPVIVELMVELPDAEKPTFEGREIVLGPRAGDYYIVREGLREGERVVTRGAFKIDGALQIVARPSMMTPSGGGGPPAHAHGGHPMKGMAPAAVEAPASFLAQLRKVQAAATGVEGAVETRDLRQIRAAFGGIIDALEGVDAAALGQEARLQWQELAMRLRNDAVVGSEVADVETARRELATLAEHVAALRGQFGLRPVDAAMAAGLEAPPEFLGQLAAVVHGYLALQDALAHDKLDAAREAVATTKRALDGADMKLLDERAHMAWMRELPSLRKALAQATEATDIHELRAAFALLSEELAAVVVAGVATAPFDCETGRLPRSPVPTDAMRAYGVTLDQVFTAVKMSNVDVGARTIEVNKVEYVIRGLGFIKRLEDIEQTVITSREGVPVTVKHVAHVSRGPALRRGALDKEGAEAVGGVVVVRYGFNPLAAIQNVKAKIKEIAPGLPTRPVIDHKRVTRDQAVRFAATQGFEAFSGTGLDEPAWLGWLRKTPHEQWPAWITTSQVTVVPFYDRTGLIYETLGTLNTALAEEILVTIVVVLVMVLHLRSSVLISSALPLAVLLCFVFMRLFGVDASIVALSGIAIAIGTIVDMSIVICENILTHLAEAPPDEDRLEVVWRATSGSCSQATSRSRRSWAPACSSAATTSSSGPPPRSAPAPRTWAGCSRAPASSCRSGRSTTGPGPSASMR